MEKILSGLRIFLLALTLAIAVWISAVTSTDPDEVRPFPNPVPLEVVGMESGLINLEKLPETVEVTLRAPSSVWQALLASPGSVRAILDLTRLSEGVHTVKVRVQVSQGPARVVSVSPAMLTITLESLLSQQMAVEAAISGQPAIGYQAGTILIDPAQVMISGPRSLVRRVARLKIDVNLSGARETIDRVLPVQAFDEKGQSVNGISILPSSVHISIPVQQMGGYRDAVVKVVVKGQVASGYHLSGISVFPPIVTLYSENPQLIQSIPAVIETEPLDLNGLKESLTTRLNLLLPTGISVIGEQSVLVQVNIAALESSLTLTGQPIEIIGPGPGLTVTILPPTVDIILSGPIPLLNTLRPRQDLRVVLDLSNLAPGTYQISPQVEVLLDGLKVESVLPSTLQVVIANAATPTP
uniref:YbbR family protein n=1 Tax=uncultured Chloroflexota bacterium TaxID=166587 RepID=H5SL40_9CHLR|nr:YbbR family protein [uncultured Chloroflexota bacterium]BAL56876.1 YbbR family protein [uncultured Chloroflexota bacterium]